MERYLTAKGENTAEFSEKRSRFIATLRHCETEEEAMDFIDEMRSKYWDARHNVFAYSVNKAKTCRFSDDGEPHGTAGKPILDVILGSGVTDIAIVVTRYFGGILLGTGGLVRAYSKSAKDAVNEALLAEMISCSVIKTVCEYTDHQRLLKLVEESGGEIETCDFAEKITLTYVLKDEAVETFLKKLSENFSARLNAEILENKIYPFEI